MAKLPSEEEVCNTVGELQSGKASGASGILQESCRNFMSALIKPMHDMWRKYSVPPGD